MEVPMAPPLEQPPGWLIAIKLAIEEAQAARARRDTHKDRDQLIPAALHLTQGSDDVAVRDQGQLSATPDGQDDAMAFTRPEDDMPGLIDDVDGISTTTSEQDSMPGLIGDGIISDDWDWPAAGEHEAGEQEAGVGSGSNKKHTRGRGRGKGFLRLAARLGVGVLVVAGAVLGAQHMAKRRSTGASSTRR